MAICEKCMNKKTLTEADLRTKLITPALIGDPLYLPSKELLKKKLLEWARQEEARR